LQCVSYKYLITIYGLIRTPIISRQLHQKCLYKNTFNQRDAESKD